MPEVYFSVGPTGKGVVFVMCCNLVTILLVQDLLLMSHLCCGLTRVETFWPLHKQYISQFQCWEYCPENSVQGTAFFIIGTGCAFYPWFMCVWVYKVTLSYSHMAVSPILIFLLRLA